MDQRVYRKRGLDRRAIYFDGTDWTLMDPTFASTSGSAKTFTGDGTDYHKNCLYTEATRHTEVLEWANEKKAAGQRGTYPHSASSSPL